MTAFELVHWEKPISDLRAWDRSPEVVKEYAVPSESEDNKAYIVTEVEALSVPFEDSDVVADNEVYFTCSCADFKYRRWPDEEPGGELTISSCKHSRSVSKVERAKQDENQSALVNE